MGLTGVKWGFLGIYWMHGIYKDGKMHFRSEKYGEIMGQIRENDG